MKEKVIKAVIIVLVLAIMLAPIIMEAINGTSLRTIKYDKFDEKLSETSNYGFAMTYVADKNDAEVADNKDSIKELMDSVISPATGEPVVAYYMDLSKLSDSERKKIFGDSKEDVAYVFMVNGEVLATEYGEKTIKELTDLVNAYSANSMTEDLTYYTNIEDAKTYSKVAKSKNDVNMAVFGKDSCFYCNQFKVVYNTVAKEKDLDIYYVNSDKVDEDEYKKIMDLGLKIPAACSKTGEEVDLQEGFDTPLTLFTKNGKVIDCISGYTNKSKLITKLETVGMLETEETKTEKDKD